MQLAIRSAGAFAAGIQLFIRLGRVDAALALLQDRQCLTQPLLLHAFALLEAQRFFVVMFPLG